MSDWLALHRIADGEGAGSRPVAWRGGKLLRRPHFLADVSAWQAAFAAEPGQRFALYFEDDAYAFATALYGAWHAGKQVVLPGNRQSATLRQLSPLVDGFAGDLPGTLQPMPSATVRREPLDRRHASLVVYTSGSGAEPVAISKSLAQLDAEVHTLQAAFGARIGAGQAAPVRVFSTVSHQHIYGLLFQVLWPLAAGRAFVTERLAYPEQMALRLGPWPSVLVSSPAHLKRLPDALDWSAARAGLQAVFSSGGPLSAEAAQGAASLLLQPPVEVFGSSETGGIAWRQQALHGERWHPFTGVAWRIEDGCLAVRSPNLPDEDWFMTSDRVRTLDDGGFCLMGRADRIVKIEEKRISLTAIETAARALPEISEASALALAGAGTERIALVAVLTAAGRERLASLGRPGFNASLRQALACNVDAVALPRRWRYVATMPVDAQGKPTQALLSALFRPLMPQVSWAMQQTTAARAELDVVPELAVFDGHFDELPVLPGVAQLDWAITLGRRCFAMPPRFLRAEALKFHKPVVPPARLALDLQWNAEAGRLSFSLASTLGVHASGRVIFADEA